MFTQFADLISNVAAIVAAAGSAYGLAQGFRRYFAPSTADAEAGARGGLSSLQGLSVGVPILTASVTASAWLVFLVLLVPTSEQTLPLAVLIAVSLAGVMLTAGKDTLPSTANGLTALGTLALLTQRISTEPGSDAALFLPSVSTYFAIALASAIMCSGLCAIEHRQQTEWRAHRSLAVYGLVATLLFSSLLCADALLHTLRNDNRTPVDVSSLPSQFRGGDAGDIQDLVSSREKAQVAYQLASELAMRPVYAQRLHESNFAQTLAIAARTEQEREIGASRLASLPSEEIMGNFLYLDQEAQRKALEARMRWSHPLPKPDQSGAIGLPGLSAAGRFDELSPARIVTIMLARPSLREKLLSIYDYSDFGIRSLVDPGSNSAIEQRIEALLGSGSSGRVARYLVLFRGISAEELDPLILQQLAIHPSSDAFVTFNQYFLYGVAVAQSRATGDEAKNVIPEFRTLPDRQRVAIQRQVFAARQPKEAIRALKEFRTFSPKELQYLATMRTSEAPQIAAAVRNHCVGLDSYTDDGEVASEVTAELAAEESILVDKAPLRPTSQFTPSRTKFIRSASWLLCRLAKNSDDKSLDEATSDIIARGAVTAYPGAIFDVATAGFAARFLSAGAKTEDVAGVFLDPIRFSTQHIAEQRGPDIAAFVRQFDLLASDSDREKVLTFIAQRSFGGMSEHALGPLFRSLSELDQRGVLGLGATGAGFLLLLATAGLLVLVVVLRVEAAMEASGARLTSLDSDDAGSASSSQRFHSYPLVGRSEVLARLEGVSKTQRGTVVVSGLRGIGKTKLMRELFASERRLGRVAVWFDCPADFNPRDFLASLYGEVVEAAEDFVRQAKGRRSRKSEYWARRLEGQALVLMAILLVSAALATWGLARPEISLPLLWVIPGVGAAAGAAYVSFSAFCVFAGWNPSGRGSEPRSAQTAMQYLSSRIREEMEVLAQYESAGDGSGWRIRPGALPAYAALAMGSLVALGSVALFAFRFIGSAISGAGGLGYPAVALGIVSILLVLGALLYLRGTSRRAAISTPTLLVRYREFVSDAARCIRDVIAATSGSGAAGNPVISVFIDEVDKIVVESAAASFLENTKVLFDIAGVRYFVSVATDQLTQVVGSRGAINRVDSSVDYVEDLGALSGDECRSLIYEYLGDDHTIDGDASLVDTCVGLSAGNPRDLLRLVDWCVLGFVSDREGLVWADVRKTLSIYSSHIDVDAVVSSLRKLPAPSGMDPTRVAAAISCPDVDTQAASRVANAISVLSQDS